MEEGFVYQDPAERAAQDSPILSAQTLSGKSVSDKMRIKS